MKTKSPALETQLFKVQCQGAAGIQLCVCMATRLSLWGKDGSAEVSSCVLCGICWHLCSQRGISHSIPGQGTLGRQLWSLSLELWVSCPRACRSRHSKPAGFPVGE